MLSITYRQGLLIPFMDDLKIGRVVNVVCARVKVVCKLHRLEEEQSVER